MSFFSTVLCCNSLKIMDFFFALGVGPLRLLVSRFCGMS